MTEEDCKVMQMLSEDLRKIQDEASKALLRIMTYYLSKEYRVDHGSS